MIQKTYNVRDKLDYEKMLIDIKSQPEYKTAKGRIVFALMACWDKDIISGLTEDLDRDLDDFKIVGFTNANVDPQAVKEGMSYRDITIKGEESMDVYSFYLFDEDCFEVLRYCNCDGTGSEVGKRLNEYLEAKEDVKGVFLVTSKGFCSMDSFFGELDSKRRKYPFFGAKASSFGFGSEGYLGFVADNDGVYEDAFIIVPFFGENIQIRANYNFGWRPLGKKFRITKTDSDMSALEIDGREATYIYKEYLGLTEEQINPVNVCEFPLVIHREKRDLARIGLKGKHPGELKFSADVYEGEEIRLSCGNPHTILKEAFHDSRSYLDFKPEAMMLIVCGNRNLLLGADEHIEVDFYRELTPELTDVRGFSEILCDKDGGGELNSALVSVAFREGVATSWASLCNDECCMENIRQREVPLLNRLMTFVDAMTRELEDMAVEANAASEAKSRFLSSMSHEIRTPINAILGLDEMIIRSTKEDETKANALGIQNSGRNLLGLINDILDVSRIESGRMEIIEVEYELSSCINDLINMIKIRADDKGLEFNVEVDPKMPHLLYGDEIRLKQCATNILTNAVKYTEEGSVNMKIGYEGIDDEHILLKFAVKDTGIGIREEDMEKLSKPFERIEEDRNRSIEGSGLGMTIVGQLLYMMGSSLKVESVYGEGSEFSFAVKQKVMDMSPIGNFNEMYERSIVTADYTESFHAPEARVLVVDDTRMNLQVFKGLLENTQLSIDTAESGADALKLYENTHYDVIFLDQRMPGMDGTQTMHEMKFSDNYVNEDTPIIVLTATVTSGAREAFINAGFTDYLSKPIDSVKLEKMLIKYIPDRKLILPGDERFKDQGVKHHDDEGDSSYVNLKKLQDIDGLDYDFALKNCMKEKILLESAQSFVQLGDAAVKEIMELLEAKDYRNYTIKVHALKSSARLIGLRSLSDMAAYLEECGDNNNIAEIEKLTPELLSSYVNYINKLGFLNEGNTGKSGNEADKPEIDKETLNEAYAAIGELAGVLDYDGVKSVLDEIGNYSLKDEDASRVKKITESLNSLDSEAIVKLVSFK